MVTDIILKPVKNAVVGVAQLKGYTNRSLATRDFCINDCYAGTRVAIYLGIHIHDDGKVAFDWFGNNAKVEMGFRILPKGGSYFDKTLWRPVEKEVMLKFLSLYDHVAMEGEEREVLANMKSRMSTLPNGRLCWDYYIGKGPLESATRGCYIRTFLANWNCSFVTFLKYHDRINTIDELVEIQNAMDEICSVAYNIKNPRIEHQKAERIEKLAKYEKFLAEKEAAINKCYEDAATALNELSERFGIEVDVSGKGGF